MGKNQFHQSTKGPSQSGKAIVEYNNFVTKDVSALPAVTPETACSNFEEVCISY
jgi:hypothetical protein